MVVHAILIARKNHDFHKILLEARTGAKKNPRIPLLTAFKSYINIMHINNQHLTVPEYDDQNDSYDHNDEDQSHFCVLPPHFPPDLGKKIQPHGEFFHSPYQQT